MIWGAETHHTFGSAYPPVTWENGDPAGTTPIDYPYEQESGGYMRDGHRDGVTRHADPGGDRSEQF